MSHTVTKPGSPLRLLLVIDSHFPGNGGTEAQVQLLAELLQARGHRVEVLAPHLDVERPFRETIRGIAVERLAYPKIPLVGALILMLRFARRLLRDRDRYDAVHIHMARNLAAAAGFVQRRLGIPLLVKVSGAWEFDGGVLDPKRRFHPVIALLNAGIRRVDYMQAISEKTRQRLLAAGYSPRRIRMIPNVVNVEPFDRLERAPPAPGRAARVIYVGRLQPVKGVTVLIEAWQHVHAEVPGARLVIAGDGPLRAELERRIAALGIGDSVEMLGRCDDVPRQLMAADIYVQPSFQEGLPNAVLEAMSASLPIVATRISGNEELVREGVNGKLVPVGDPRRLASAIIELLAQPTGARRMGLASRQIIDGLYVPDRVLAMLEHAYRGSPAEAAAEVVGTA
jgi:L-malate glycosyltransferase